MIVERYVIREILRPVVVVCGILVTIFASYLTARFLGDAVDGLLSPRAVAQLVGLRVLVALEVLLPIALFLGVVMALGRLHSDAETVALAACGVSPSRLLGAVAAVAVVTAGLVGPMSLWGRPWAYDMAYRVRARAALEVDVTRFQARRFYEKQRGDRVVFAERLEGDRLEGVFVQREQAETVEVIWAERARQRMDAATGQQVLVAEQGRQYRLSREVKDDRVVAFSRLEISLRDRDVAPEYRKKAASVSALVASGRAADVAELQWRLTTPLGTLFLALLGVPLSRAAPRRGRYARFGVAVLVYAVYFNLKAVAKTTVEHGWVGTVPGLWWVDLLLAALVVVALWRRP
jgi:lipopolysaccharide export system permease protein